MWALCHVERARYGKAHRSHQLLLGNQVRRQKQRRTLRTCVARILSRCDRHPGGGRTWSVEWVGDSDSACRTVALTSLTSRPQENYVIPATYPGEISVRTWSPRWSHKLAEWQPVFEISAFWACTFIHQQQCINTHEADVWLHCCLPDEKYAARGGGDEPHSV